MTKKITLTGIKTTGTPHLGNYAGAIRPAVLSSQQSDGESYFFLADYHSLIGCQDPELVHQSTREIAATWLAAGLDPENTVFYRQSDVPEILELSWLLSCMAAKGLMNRAHAYKDSVQKNADAGLFSYPVLMAADILMFNATHVPVGRDQIQHIEMARDIAQRFNHFYGEHFVLPEAVVGEDVAVLQGLDGQKMSKSYNNTIPLFLPEKQLKKHINKIKTNLLEPGEPKDPDTSTVFQIWKAFATQEQAQEMRVEFENGIAWGEAKRRLFELLNDQLGDARENYNALLEDGDRVEQILQDGGKKAREFATPFIGKLRKAVGIRPL
ncbi:UNVERIFIED_CONTAM: hypothetical protein GTU68_017369 [Idotea baltica]|nr:hypothetical protein [Idotea baltica]